MTEEKYLRVLEDRRQFANRYVQWVDGGRVGPLSPKPPYPGPFCVQGCDLDSPPQPIASA